MSTYDAIIIGSSIEGLATAGLLAKAGRHVIVLEARDVLGGLAAPRAFHDGFTAPGVLHDASCLHEDVVRRLALERHGLVRHSTPTVRLADEDGGGIAIDHSGVSGPDADRFAAWRAWIKKVSPVVHQLLDNPAPPLDGSLPRLAWSALRLGATLRKLGRRDMTEFLRVPPMCAADWLNEWFEDERLKAGLAAPALEGLWGGPWSAGTAANLLFREVMSGPDVAGGASAVVDALAACLREAGAELRTGARVTAIRCRNGRAMGVSLHRGDTVDAPIVASALDPQTTLLDLLSPTDIPPDLAHDVTGWRCRGTTAKVHLAIEGPAPFIGDDGRPVDVARTGASLDDLERAFDAVKYGEMSEHPVLDIRVPSLVSPELAPEGHHVVSIMAHFAPFELRAGWSDETRELLGRNVVATLARHVPDIADRIVAQETLTPADLEAELGLCGGHVHHGEMALDQMLSLRPSVGCADHSAPVPGVFLCGPGTHPGPNPWMGCARLAARRILAR
ncbi:MAG: NAD(P)/FAD-dependent oxidoreductase [Planctomycetes bacterium]|nr:NAD(P)/FAD-dependent oxidoreductase [Planctomycetota bacterium]